MIFTLRSAQCHDNPILESIDALIRDTLSRTLNIDLCDQAWQQASLPVNASGLGLRTASSLALPAYLSSVASTRDEVKSVIPDYTGGEDAQRLLEEWKTASGLVAPKAEAKQKEWDKPLVAKALGDLLSRCETPRDVCRVRACTDHNAGDWLKVLPSTNLGLVLDDEEFRAATCLRLGLAFYESHQCPCGQQVDRNGDHSFVCAATTANSSGT